MAESRVFVGDVAKKAAQHVSLVAPAGSSVAVSGGSLPKILAKGLQDTDASQLPSTWAHLFLADERCVPLDHPDSNYRSARDHLKCHPIPIDPSLSTSACALDYANKLTEKLGEVPIFDCVLLGLGPDGHTCSLFPGHPLLEEKESLVAPIEDSPKPPPNRVTLTLRALENAKDITFVVTGESKADVIQDIIENPNSAYPGALVRGKSITWFLDEGAASKLKASSVILK